VKASFRTKNNPNIPSFIRIKNLINPSEGGRHISFTTDIVILQISDIKEITGVIKSLIKLKENYKNEKNSENG